MNAQNSALADKKGGRRPIPMCRAKRERRAKQAACRVARGGTGRPARARVPGAGNANRSSQGRGSFDPAPGKRRGAPRMAGLKAIMEPKDDDGRAYGTARVLKKLPQTSAPAAHPQAGGARNPPAEDGAQHKAHAGRNRKVTRLRVVGWGSRGAQRAAHVGGTVRNTAIICAQSDGRSVAKAVWRSRKNPAERPISPAGSVRIISGYGVHGVAAYYPSGKLASVASQLPEHPQGVGA